MDARSDAETLEGRPRRPIPPYIDGDREPEWERFEDQLKAGRLLARRYYLDEGIGTDSARAFRSWTDAMLGRSTDPITLISSGRSRTAGRRRRPGRA